MTDLETRRAEREAMLDRLRTILVAQLQLGRDPEPNSGASGSTRSTPSSSWCAWRASSACGSAIRSSCASRSAR